MEAEEYRFAEDPVEISLQRLGAFRCVDTQPVAEQDIAGS